MDDYNPLHRQFITTHEDGVTRRWDLPALDWATKDLFPLGTVPATAFDFGSYRGKDSYQGANQKSFFTHIRLSGIASATTTLRTMKLSPEAEPGADQLSPLLNYEANAPRNGN